MAVSGSLKLPPPPVLAKTDPAFNRWLLEVTAVLAAAGGIDPTQIVGWNELVADVAQNSLDIDSLQTSVIGLQGLTITQGDDIAALQARNQVYNGALGAGTPSNALGVDNDWFYNRTGLAGNRLFIKLAGAWAAQAI